MNFVNPGWLWFLLAIPPAFAWFFWDQRRRRERFKTFAAEAAWPIIAPEIDWKARTRKAVVWSIAIALGVTALARPQWGSHEETVTATGLDIMVVLDISRSMDVEDVVPSRLKKAKHLIRTITEGLKTDRIGLVPFAGTAYVACPLTTDVDYFREQVEMMDPQLIQNQGTDVGAGLEAAFKSLERGAEEVTSPIGAGQEAKEASTRIVLLISDGEDHEEGAIEAAQALKQAGVKLYVFGIGTDQGGPVPIRSESGVLQGFKKEGNQPILSKFDPKALMEVAAASGGRYWNVSMNEAEADELLSELGVLDRTEFAERKIVIYEERFQVPLALAVLLLLLELSVPARRIGRVSAVILGVLLGGVRAQAAPSLEAYLENDKGLEAYQGGDLQEAHRRFGSAQALDPTVPELKFNQGVAQLQQENWDGAIAGFGGAAKDALERGDHDLAGKSLFNLGHAFGKKGDLKGAVGSYLGAIEEARHQGNVELEADARKNLELLVKQEQQKKQQQGDEQQEGQENEDGQDSQGGDNEKQGQGKDDEQQKQAQGEGKKPKKYQDPSKGRQREFKSEKLSKEDADKVMAEFANRERELKTKLNKMKGQQARKAKDW